MFDATACDGSPDFDYVIEFDIVIEFNEPCYLDPALYTQHLKRLPRAEGFRVYCDMRRHMQGPLPDIDFLRILANIWSKLTPSEKLLYRPPHCEKAPRTTELPAPPCDECNVCDQLGDPIDVLISSVDDDDLWGERDNMYCSESVEL